LKNGLIKDLEELNFADEVFPIGKRNIDKLKRDFHFWFVSSLGVVPLMIITLPDHSSRILALSLLFAFIWGVVFKKLVMQDSGGWLLPIGSLFFTGALAAFALKLAYALMPSFYLELHKSTNSLVELGGYIFRVGIWEELCKVVPIFIYMAWERRKERSIDPLTLIVIGVFSGLGFAAFENMRYAEAAANALQTRDAMIIMVVRSLSLIFCHASWSGIFAYFIAIASYSGKRWGALFVVGLGVSSLLHGFYDWFCGTQPSLAALTAGFSFMLFYSYMSKFHALTSTGGSQSPAALDQAASF
jgi:protease PrsW